jgi:hypothetical protein
MSVAALVTGALGVPGSSGVSKPMFPIEMPFWTLKALTAFPPTGILGMNHAAMHNQALALLKAGSVAMSVLAVTYMLPYYPDYFHKPIIFLSCFGPWFMFDILELIFNEPHFKAHGFRLPLNFELEGLTAGKATTGQWELTPALAAGIMAALASCGLILANLIPPTLLPVSVSQNVSIVTGSAGLIFGGLALAAMFATGGSGSKAPPHSTTPPSTGGGDIDIKMVGGASLPPLSQFADKLINAKSPDESLAFLSIIGLVVMGGLFTAWSKQ